MPATGTISKKNIEFFINPAFADQEKRHVDMNEADEFGFINIQDKF